MLGLTTSRSEPMEEMRLSTESCAPVPIASMATTEPTPMTMPSKVRMVRKRLARNARNAILTASVTSAIAAEPSLTVRLERMGCVRIAAALLGAVGDDAAVMDFDQPVGLFGDLARVGDDDDRVATCRSCSRKSAMTSEPLWLSSAPVGSSASTTRPPFISARAIDTRCCWPPESWFGRWSSRSPSFN